MLRNYILIIAKVSNKILNLPKSTLKNDAGQSDNCTNYYYEGVSMSEEMSESEEDEDDDLVIEHDNEIQDDGNDNEGICSVYTQRKSQNCTLTKSYQQTESITLDQITELEQKCLVECIQFLNEQNRVQIIVDSIDNYLQDEELLSALSEICHNLMIYNRMAIFEYK